MAKEIAGRKEFLKKVEEEDRAFVEKILENRRRKQEEVSRDVKCFFSEKIKNKKSYVKVIEEDIATQEEKIMESFTSKKLTSIELGNMLSLLKKLNKVLAIQLVKESNNPERSNKQ